MAILAQGTQPEVGRLPGRKEHSVVSQKHYTTSVIRTLDQFAALASPWDALLDAAEEVNISLRHAWLQLWLSTFKHAELMVIIVQDDEERLMAAAPLVVSRNDSGLFCRALRRLQFIGTSPEVYDWMKILQHPEVDVDSAFRLLGEQLIRNRARWDIADLRYIESQVQLTALHRLISPIAQESQISQPMTIPYIDLPEDWEAYPPALRKKKYQSDLNRIRNHIRNDFHVEDAELIVHQPGEVSDRQLAQFVNFHRDYWQARGCRTEAARHPKLLDFFTQAYREFSRERSEQKNGGGPVFEFSTLALGGETVSYHFDIQTPHGCMGYLSCYDQQAKKYRPGILHIEALIARTHRLGGRRFEFGRGDEHYKNQWHIEKKPLWNLLAFRTPLARLLWQLDETLKNLEVLKTLKARLTNGTTAHDSNAHSSTVKSDTSAPDPAN